MLAALGKHVYAVIKVPSHTAIRIRCELRQTATHHYIRLLARQTAKSAPPARAAKIPASSQLMVATGLATGAAG
ncbi:hypothetical protein A6X21_04150 [Planctopirus hydrillae]|uniref:Uncharacterized protein n=1 Tax=Planctopirus hydrillae TaxID=1841610 RepID=A0A1C3ENQ1_9PLAN|nr:hypothetical protein A6X21_04150 [Planctopirus hydrillae]